MSAVTARLRAAGCVFAEEEAQLLVDASADAAELDRLLGARTSGVPLEHVLGWVEFCGLRIVVDRDVFVPRRRTEMLVREALRRVPHPGIVIDLCCGCGAVGLAIAVLAGSGSGGPTSGRADPQVHAVDIDARAVDCARLNLAGSGHRVHHGDLYTALPTDLRGRADLVVANAPYVPTAAMALMPPEAREHEPVVALDGGPDGLALHRRIAGGAPDWLAPGGVLLIETSDRQADRSAAAVRAAGLPAEIVRVDEATVVAASAPPR